MKSNLDEEKIPSEVKSFIDSYLSDNMSSIREDRDGFAKVLYIPKDILEFVCTEQGTALVRAIMHHKIPADVFKFVSTERGITIVRQILSVGKDK